MALVALVGPSALNLLEFGGAYPWTALFVGLICAAGLAEISTVQNQLARTR